jgi:hypothetical protein
MKGHTELIRLRTLRKAPRIVFINDYPCDTSWHENPGDAVTISTDGDVVQFLDLRLLVGLTVSISSPSEVRAKALFAGCKAAGAKVVAACHIQPDVQPWEQKGWTQVWRKTQEVVHGECV